MRYKKSVSVAFCFALVPVTGCGSELEPPKSVCSIKTPASAIVPLLPEEGEVTVKGSESIAAPSACTVYVDKKRHLVIMHNPRTTIVSLPPELTRTPPRDFDGKLGISSLGAMAVANCTGKRYVMGYVELHGDEKDGSQKKLEKFMNAYMPALLKKYGCKS
jgi:hypothetical protein